MASKNKSKKTVKKAAKKTAKKAVKKAVKKTAKKAAKKPAKKKKTAKKGRAKTKTEGAVKAGPRGKRIFDLLNMGKIHAGGTYSTAHGPLVESDKVLVGLICKPRGTGARPHKHPNEQWNYIVQGRLRIDIDGEKKVAGPGTLLYFPPNVVHSTVALPEEDVYFFVIKDLSHDVHGIPADGKDTGPYYEKGFEPGARK
ncbi:MAG: cupin domain-containing protein [Rhodospirillales bacterium]